MRPSLLAFAAATAVMCSPAAAKELGTLKRLDEKSVELSFTTNEAPLIWLSDDTNLGAGDTRVDVKLDAGKATLALPVEKRVYVILQSKDGSTDVIAERVLPLEQASNFRDVGGYQTKDGRTVKWGKVYRSGAMPLLTDKDFGYIGGLILDSIVDFRSLEEREVVPNMVDDKTGALFLANDYSIADMMKDYESRDGENNYARMESFLRPQYRAVFRRIIADDGAVLYHCSAGQDRTGVATALLYDILGVDRDTIVKDYHLSTQLRQTKWEMPEVDPKDYPGNFIVQYYVENRKSGKGPQPLYTPSGASHIVQFMAHIDKEYGGAEGYLKQALGLSEAEIEQLRTVMLEG